jgi:hypothetical protein
MRPFPRVAISNDSRKKKFNKQLGSVFRPIETGAETAERVVKAACCLHNYILRNNTNVAATETEHVATVRAFSDTSSTNLRSNNAAFEALTLTGEYCLFEIQPYNFCTHA